MTNCRNKKKNKKKTQNQNKKFAKLKWKLEFDFVNLSNCMKLANLTSFVNFVWHGIYFSDWIIQIKNWNCLVHLDVFNHQMILKTIFCCFEDDFEAFVRVNFEFSVERWQNPIFFPVIEFLDIFDGFDIINYFNQILKNNVARFARCCKMRLFGMITSISRRSASIIMV